MVNPGAFRGSRKDFLLGEKVAYAAGVDGGYAADALAIIQRRYFKRYPLELKTMVEPTPEFLAAVNDEEPEPEETEPDEEEMGIVEYAVAVRAIETRRDEVAFRKAQIKRWLAYQYMKDHDMDAKDSGAHNPYRGLLHKLTGTTIQRPRLKTAVNIWRKTQRTAIDAEVSLIALRDSVEPRRLVALRDRVAREMYDGLDKPEKEQWHLLARDEHTAAMAAWEADNTGNCSTLPADRQRCIQGLVKFAQPILDLICEATGWKATLITGGPEPADEGRLNIISVHSGTTSGDVAMNFGRAGRVGYKKNLIPLYGQFLQRCYTPEECRSRSLPIEDGFEPLISTELDQDGANLDSWGFGPTNTITTDSNATTSSSAQPLTTLSVPSTAVVEAAEISISSTPQAVLVPQTELSPSRGLSPPLSHGLTPPGSRGPTPPPSPATSTSLPPAPLSLEVDSTRVRQKRKQQEIEEPSEPPVSASASVVLVRRTRNCRGAASTVTTSSVSAPSKPPASALANASSSSSSTTTLAAVTGASSAPMWFTNTLSMLQTDSEKLGPRWMQLVALWAGFEEREKYTGITKLKSTNRPSIVSDWIQRARSSSWRPVIKSVVDFEATFLVWWTMLQPEWRVMDGVILKDVVEGDWSVLRKPGTNGIVSILAALFHWGLHAHQLEKDRKQWALSVEDCYSAFLQLTA